MNGNTYPCIMPAGQQEQLQQSHDSSRSLPLPPPHTCCPTAQPQQQWQRQHQPQQQQQEVLHGDNSRGLGSTLAGGTLRAQQKNSRRAVAPITLQHTPHLHRHVSTSYVRTGVAGKVHRVELAVHHLTHPVQGLKHHTVDKAKRKVKAKLNGAVNHLVDKVMP